MSASRKDDAAKKHLAAEREKLKEKKASEDVNSMTARFSSAASVSKPRPDNHLRASPLLKHLFPNNPKADPKKDPTIKPPGAKK